MRDKQYEINGGIVTKKAIALGTFDGIHSAHRAVIESAKPYDLTVLTFRTPPKSSNSLLMLPEDKEKSLYELGAENVVFLDFEKIRNIEASDFLNIIKSEYNPEFITCGFNYRFGKDALGDAKLIEKYCFENGIEFSVLPPMLDNEKPISSTAIRGLLSEGKILEANKQIYGGFGFSTPVIHGDARGRTIGFPTANQEYPKLLTKLKFGVYSSKIVFENKEYDCITNIGIRPTFKSDIVLCESYIPGFDGDIYGKTATLKPQRFIRSEQKFGSLDELTKAIKSDITNIGANVNKRRE